MGRKSSGNGSKSVESGGKAAAGDAKQPTLRSIVNDAVAIKKVPASKGPMKEYLKANHPDLKYSDSTLNTTLSNVRKSLGIAPTGRGGRRGRAAKLTVEEVLLVKGAVRERGGMEAFKTQLSGLLGVIDKVGGVGRLKECLKK